MFITISLHVIKELEPEDEDTLYPIQLVAVTEYPPIPSVNIRLTAYWVYKETTVVSQTMIMLVEGEKEDQSVIERTALT